MICQMHIVLCLFTLKDELFVLTMYGYVSIPSTELGQNVERIKKESIEAKLETM